MTKKRGLGRGLSALLEDPGTDITTRTGAPAPRVTGSVSELPIVQIEPNPFQPRTTFSPEALNELSSSIRQLGIVQPVTVRKVGVDRYQLISGERRFRASQLAGLEQIPAYIRVANDEAMLEMALVENIQREELDAIEVAISFQRLIEEVQLTQEQLSAKVGKDRTTISNYLRLLKLPPEVQLGLRQKQIGMGHARALINIGDPERQVALYRRIVESQLSVREVEGLARESKSSEKRHKASSIVLKEDKERSTSLGDALGRRVKVRLDPNGKGFIEIAVADWKDVEHVSNSLAKLT